MAKCVVEGLEVVEIDRQQCAHAAGKRPRGESDFEPVNKQTAVWEACQRVI